MTNLLMLKEKIVGFYKDFEYPLQVVGKFVLAFLAFNYINNELGYFEALTGVFPVLFLSIICAIVPVSVFVLIFALVVVLHLFKLSMMLSAIALVVFILFYVIYLKFAPDQGILIVLYPVLAQFNLHYMIPMVGAMAFNPFAALPIAFGVILMKVIGCIQEAAAMGDPGTDVQDIMTSYQYVFDKLFADKEMIAYIVVFTLVILLVYGISRLQIDYSWYIAIGVGTLVNIIGLSMQASGIEGMNIAMIVVGSVFGGLLAALVQFAGCTLDYARKESLQFEDDDYYYYVKAIPKIQMARAEKTVKTFGKKTKESQKKAKGSADTDTIVRKTPRPEPVKAAVEEPMKAQPQPAKPQTVKPQPVKPQPQPRTISDFDELSFDGFDFDELDQK
jgi:hypothetical protein